MFIHIFIFMSDARINRKKITGMFNIPGQMLSKEYYHFLCLYEEHLGNVRMLKPSNRIYRCELSVLQSNYKNNIQSKLNYFIIK